MKKTAVTSFILAAVLLLSACGGGAVSAPAPSAPAPAAPETVGPAAPVPSAAPAAAALPGGDGSVDVDLTLLSSTMVYAEVSAMCFGPERYSGRTVKMKGTFSVIEGEEGQLYFACVIKDATACCAQGLEFELSDGGTFPEDYPEEGTEITVVGTFDTYEEVYDGNTYQYIVLRDAELV